MPDGTYAVALHARNEAELRELDRALECAGLPRHLVIEADAPYEGQAMALGVPPCDRSLVRKHLRHLPLVSDSCPSIDRHSALST